MKLFNLSLFICFFLCSCSNSKVTPAEAAEQACECMKLSADKTEEGRQAFNDCSSKTTEMMSEYRSDFEWMEEWRKEYVKCVQDAVNL